MITPGAAAINRELGRVPNAADPEGRRRRTLEKLIERSHEHVDLDSPPERDQLVRRFRSTRSEVVKAYESADVMKIAGVDYILGERARRREAADRLRAQLGSTFLNGTQEQREACVRKWVQLHRARTGKASSG